MRSGEDTLQRDRDGKAITVHSYIADESGERYYVNAFCQAVPVGEGAAVPLEDLVKGTPVRLLTAAEVLQLENAKKGVSTTKATSSEKKERKARTRAAKPDAGQLEPDAPEEPEKGAEQANDDVSDDTVRAEINMVIQMIPDRLLADELRRRGYVFSAVKPVVIEI